MKYWDFFLTDTKIIKSLTYYYRILFHPTITKIPQNMQYKVAHSEDFIKTNSDRLFEQLWAVTTPIAHTCCPEKELSNALGKQQD